MYDDGRVVLDLDNNPVMDFRDLPATLSSEVEPALLEAIRRIEPRIRWQDCRARLSVFPLVVSNLQRLTDSRPIEHKGGKTVGGNALNSRARHFRLENRIAIWDKKRRGTKELNGSIEKDMSPAALAANSTRELSKLSKQEQKDVVGKHPENAAGWALPLRAQNDAQEKLLAPSKVRKRKKPVQRRPRKGKGRSAAPETVSPEGEYAGNQQNLGDPIPEMGYTSQGPSLWISNGFAPIAPNVYPGSGRHNLCSYGSSSSQACNVLTGDAMAGPYQNQSCAGESSRTGENIPNHLADSTDLFNVPAPVHDYRKVPPQKDEDIKDIYEALQLTRNDFVWRTEGQQCPETGIWNSYLDQQEELQGSFDTIWRFRLRRPDPVPILPYWQVPWTSGFRDWDDAWLQSLVPADVDPSWPPSPAEPGDFILMP